MIDVIAIGILISIAIMIIRFAYVWGRAGGLSENYLEAIERVRTIEDMHEELYGLKHKNSQLQFEIKYMQRDIER